MYGTYCRLNMHVSASNREVIRAFRNKMLTDAAKLRVNRVHRHRMIVTLLQLHKNEQDLVRQWRL